MNDCGDDNLMHANLHLNRKYGYRIFCVSLRISQTHHYFIVFSTLNTTILRYVCWEMQEGENSRYICQTLRIIISNQQKHIQKHIQFFELVTWIDVWQPQRTPSQSRSSGWARVQFSHIFLKSSSFFFSYILSNCPKCCCWFSPPGGNYFFRTWVCEILKITLFRFKNGIKRKKMCVFFLKNQLILRKSCTKKI